MTLDALSRLARWTEKLATAARQIADELTNEAARAQQHRDPLAAHIYRSRARYRQTSDGDKTKHGTRTDGVVQDTYRDAVKLGFIGGRGAWRELLAATPRE